MTLQSLLAEPKGKTSYSPSESFLLHVHWEAPSLAVAQEILASLRLCAAATHRDTPCVPLYFFRISSLDHEHEFDTDNAAGGRTSSLPIPRTVEQHNQLWGALKKLRMGVPRPAVEADLVRRNLPTSLLDADPTDTLPEELQQQPVMLELTELYLDGRAFFEHAGSRDYLAAYAGVTAPRLQNHTSTIRSGTPPEGIVDSILAPMLKEQVHAMPEGCVPFRRPEKVRTPVMISLSTSAKGGVEELMGSLPRVMLEKSVTMVVFPHSVREGHMRALCVMPYLPEVETLREVAGIAGVEAMEIRCNEADAAVLSDELRSVGLGEGTCRVAVIMADQAGYVLHAKAGTLETL